MALMSQSLDSVLKKYLKYLENMLMERSMKANNSIMNLAIKGNQTYISNFYTALFNVRHQFKK